MTLTLILPLLSLIPGQAWPKANVPYPSYHDESLSVRQLRALDFVAIVEPTGDGELADRKVVSLATKEMGGDASHPWPESAGSQLVWSQPFRVVDGYGTGVGATVTGYATLHGQTYRSFRLEAGPMPRIGQLGSTPTRYIMVAGSKLDRTLSLSHGFRGFPATYFDTDTIRDVRPADGAMVYLLIPTRCIRLTLGSDLCTTVLRTLADSIACGGDDPVRAATDALARFGPVDLPGAEPIEGMGLYEWRDRVIGASLAATVRSGKLEPAERLRVSSLVFGWGDGTLHDDYLKAIVDRDKSGTPLPDELFSWCFLARRTFLEDVKTHGIYFPGLKSQGMEGLYGHLTDVRSKILFVLDWHGAPHLESTYKLLLRDMQSENDALVGAILRKLHGWSHAGSDLEPERGWEPGQPRPAQWNRLIERWSQPGAFGALEAGKGKRSTSCDVGRLHALS